MGERCSDCSTLIGQSVWFHVTPAHPISVSNGCQGVMEIFHLQAKVTWQHGGYKEISLSYGELVKLILLCRQSLLLWSMESVRQMKTEEIWIDFRSLPTLSPKVYLFIYWEWLRCHSCSLMIFIYRDWSRSKAGSFFKGKRFQSRSTQSISKWREKFQDCEPSSQNLLKNRDTRFDPEIMFKKSSWRSKILHIHFD